MFTKLEVSEDEIKDTLRLFTVKPVNQRTVPADERRANTAQRNLISDLKLYPTPIRIGHYCLIKADLLDYMIKHFDKHPVPSPD